MQTFHFFFRVACERFLQTCRNNGNPLKLKLSLLPTLSKSVTDPLLLICKTVLMIELWKRLCLNLTLEKFQKSVIFGKKLDFLLNNFFFVHCMKLKTVFEYALWFV